MKIAIIGGGASGMVCAYVAKNLCNEVMLFEKNSVLGKKLSATGNGRGNLAHQEMNVAHFHSSTTKILRNWFDKLTPSEVLAVLNDMGIVFTLDKRGRYYPLSFEAKSVSELIGLALEKKGVKTHINTEVLGLSKVKQGYLLELSSGKTYLADKVVIATGGLAAPQLGASTSGYDFLCQFGHELVAPKPAIVHLESKDVMLKYLDGLKWTCKVGFLSEKQTWFDEVHFAKTALSGPAIFQASIVYQKMKKPCKTVVIDLLPDYDEKTLKKLVFDRKNRFNDKEPEVLLLGILPKKLIRALFSRLKTKGVKTIGTFGDKAINDLVCLIKAFDLSVSGTRDFKFSQSTLGGINLRDFNEDSFESYLSEGLYATGEVLDVCGDCGGYNLYFAWLTGILIGRSLQGE